MSVSAVITIPAAEFALGGVLAETGVRIELPQFVQIGGSLVPYLWVAEPYNHAAFEQRVEADDRVASVRLVDDLAEKSLYRIEWANGIDDLLDLFIDGEIRIEQANTVERAEGIDDRAPAGGAMGGGADVWRFQLRAPTREALATLIEGCRAQGMNPRIQQVITSPDSAERDQWSLTDKQRESLLAAYENGYFDVPRGASLTDLAEDFDISRQSFTRRLMRGFESVLERTIVVEQDYTEPGDER